MKARFFLSDVACLRRCVPGLLAALGAWLWMVPAQAADGGLEVDWLALGMGLFGGLALFLAGLELLSEGLKEAAGNGLKVALSKLTTNRFMGALTGAFVTGILNSSSVTTVLVVGFVTAGVMSLSQSVGVIMGANIGSTMTAQLLAFNLTAYSLLAVATGFFMLFAGKRERVKHYGMMIMGLGLVFYGMGVMSDGMRPLRGYEPFLELLRGMEKPLLGILCGALFTALVQSSAATVGIAIAMASEGLLSLPGGITLALGANVGTCATALLAAMGKPPEAVRAAVVHLIFNIAGVLVWLPLIPWLAMIAVTISPTTAAAEGVAHLAVDVPRQIANANTLFNVINTLLFIGFTGWFARIAERLVPARESTPGTIIEPEFLDEAALVVPALALERVRQEFGRAGAIAVGMLEDFGAAVRDRDINRVEEIARRDDQVDILEEAMLAYLGRIRQMPLGAEESLTHQQLMTAVVNLESLADVIETDLAQIARRMGQRPTTSDQVAPMFTDLHASVCRATALAVEAVRDDDQQAAQQVMHMKTAIQEQAERLLARESAGLRPDDADYLTVARLQMSLLDKQRQIYTLAKRIAKVALPEALAQRD